MTVAGPRRICTGFLRRHRLTGDIVASRLRLRARSCKSLALFRYPLWICERRAKEELDRLQIKYVEQR